MMRRKQSSENLWKEDSRQRGQQVQEPQWGSSLDILLGCKGLSGLGAVSKEGLAMNWRDRWGQIPMATTRTFNFILTYRKSLKPESRPISHVCRVQDKSLKGNPSTFLFPLCSILHYKELHTRVWTPWLLCSSSAPAPLPQTAIPCSLLKPRKAR